MSVVHKVAASGGRVTLLAQRQSSLPPLLTLCRQKCVGHQNASLFYRQRISSLSRNIGARAASRQFSKSTMDKAAKETTSSTKVVAAEQPASSFAKFWNWYLGETTMPPRWTLPWYREMLLVCFVFAITGSSTMVLVRFVVCRFVR
jgi:membrane-bound lytic murein transglycosylase B